MPAPRLTPHVPGLGLLPLLLACSASPWPEPAARAPAARSPGASSRYYDTAAWTLDEEVATDPDFGASLGSADVNGDGYMDVIVGASGWEGGIGAVFVYHSGEDGPDTLPDATLEGLGWEVEGSGDLDDDGYGEVTVADATDDSDRGVLSVCAGGPSGTSETCAWTLSGEAEGDQLGASSASADVNGDGVADLVVGAPGATSGAGRVYVFHGSPGGLPSAADFTLDGDAGEGLGSAIAAAGDLDGDGYEDVALGASGAGGGGEVTVLYGSASGLEAAGALTLSGTAGEQFGFCLDGAGDLNADGFDDLVVGAPGKLRAYTFHGSASGLSSTSAATLSSPTGASTGTTGYVHGWIVRGAGDVDGDGYDDIVVGRERKSSIPFVYLYNGSATGVPTTYTGRLYESNTFAASLWGMGDLNGDGVDDVAAGQPDSTYNAEPGGTVNLFLDVARTAEETFNTLDAEIERPAWYTGIGYTTLPVGDLDGDGYDDVLIGMDDDRAALFYGSSAGLPDTPEVTLSRTDGATDFSATGDCDVNNDGFGDILGYESRVDGTLELSVFLGSTAVLDTTASQTLTLPAAAGYVVGCAGDIDADGYDDVYFVGDCDSGDTSCAWLYHGEAAGLGTTPDEPVELYALEVYDSCYEDDEGTSYSTRPLKTTAGRVGDLNGDGYDDLAVGFTGSGCYDDYDGFIYIYYGIASGLPSTYDAKLDSGDGMEGYRLARAGDVNGDGYDDLLSTSFYDVETDDYAVEIFLGSSAGVASASRYALDLNVDESYGFPYAACIGDTNLDGFDDLAVGGRTDEALGAWVLKRFDGASGLTSAGTWALTDQSAPFSGRTSTKVTAVANAGDVNGDGYDDLMLGSYSSSHVGHVDVYYGYVDTDEDGVPDLSDCGPSDAADTSSPTAWYTDADGDGYGDPATEDSACEAPAAAVADASDCDDSRAEVSPVGVEVCDGLDNDCDGVTDEADAADASTWYLDEDGDGFGLATISTVACTPPEGYASAPGDCDDTRADLRPDAAEVCDGLDNDCDLEVDVEAVDAPTWHADADGDSFGDPAVATSACEAPVGAVLDDQDCDDADAGAFPGATETAGDGVDQDCDGADTPLEEDSGDTGDTGDSGDTGESGDTGDSSDSSDSGDTGDSDSASKDSAAEDSAPGDSDEPVRPAVSEGCASEETGETGCASRGLSLIGAGLGLALALRRRRA